jgi:hypothetical protein
MVLLFYQLWILENDPISLGFGGLAFSPASEAS